jgi:hypothetical protein
MVLARESRDHASVAQRSASSLAGVLPGGLMPASVRNWVRSPAYGRGILAAVQILANVAGAMAFESRKRKQGASQLLRRNLCRGQQVIRRSC